MATTARGYPYPEATDANDAPTQIKALADKNDARPGVSPLTSAARDALTGAELWDGREIVNTDTRQTEVYDLAAAVWRQPGVSTAGGSTITASGAAVRGLVVKGAAGQTANLLEVQDNAGTVLLTVTQNGAVAAGNGGGYLLHPTNSTQNVFTATAPGNLPLRVRGAASQTANLAEFQNSAGTVLTSVGPDGRMYHDANQTSATAGAVVGYLFVNIAGTARKIPFHAV